MEGTTKTKKWDWGQDVLCQIRNANMDESVIFAHQQRVLEALASKDNRTFPIFDTCRLENGGILRLPQLDQKIISQENEDIGIVAFVPAAGASSRYLAPLIPLLDAARMRDAEACVVAVMKMEMDGVMSCPLPSSIKLLLTALKSGITKVSDDLFEQVVREIDAPKALYPAVLEGDSFLCLKRLEHKNIGGLLGEIYICPPGRSADFNREASTVASSLESMFIEQDSSLATLRFESSGQVALDDHGQISSVPAGHGALLPLLPRVREFFPKARAVFIRNIDNISGNSPLVVEATRSFKDNFCRTLSLMDRLRDAASQHDMVQLKSIGQSILDIWGITTDAADDPLESLFSRLFHTNVTKMPEDLQRLLARPLVLMGQVPNSANDVGGTCVFADVDGWRQKLCIEVPHVSETDRQVFLENAAKATHFNPVFVMAEIPGQTMINAWNSHPFWLVAKKSWNGRQVYYQESILYEMLGCGHYANVLFVEVPRAVFNPHKSLKDAGQKHLRHWIKS